MFGMNRLKAIRIDPGLRLEKDHFGIDVGNNALRVPEDFKSVVDEHRVTTPRQFVSIVDLLNLELASRFRWAPSEVSLALTRLLLMLKNRFPNDPEWQRHTRFERGSGALNVRDIPRTPSPYDER